MLRLFQRKLIFVVECFRRNHFKKKNEFPDNIIRQLAHTKKFQTQKMEFGNSSRNPATSGSRRRIPTSNIPTVMAEIRLVWPFWPELAGIKPNTAGVQLYWPAFGQIRPDSNRTGRHLARSGRTLALLPKSSRFGQIRMESGLFSQIRSKSGQIRPEFG